MNDQNLESDTPFFATAAKNGFLFGGVLIIISLIYQLAGLSANFFWSMLIGILTMVIYALASYRSIKEHRDVDLSGYISFKRAFLTGLVAAVIAGLVATIYSIVYIQFIDPGSVQEAIDSVRDMMEKMGQDEEIIEQAMADAKKRMQDPKALLIQGAGTALVVGALASLVVAAMMKNPAPEA